MARKKNGRKHSPKRKKSGKARGQKNYSTIQQHSRSGKKLSPPLARISKMTPVSWINDRLPEMLWAVLLTHCLGRDRAVDVYREVAKRLLPLRGALGKDAPFDLTLSAISILSPDVREVVLSAITEDADSREALASLLLFESLPGREHWISFLVPEGKGDWSVLASAVLDVLDHQSDASTDCRWVRLLGQLAIGRMIFPSGMDETLLGIIRYPEYGDLRMVRPTIRSAEMTLGMFPESPMAKTTSGWADEFWRVCLTETGCTAIQRPGNPIRVGTDRAAVDDAIAEVVELCNDTRTTSGLDARHDASFGLAIYSLTVLREMLGIGVSASILGQAGLRTLLEVYVTFKHLADQDDPDLWTRFRSYGAGQAKLAFLKAEESEQEDGFVSRELLEMFANEDIWQEYLEIELGHWAGKDLRRLSMESGGKVEYDRYYGWTSGYVHGSWSAIRSVAFDVCGNPLHRLHRIPRSGGAGLGDVLVDAVALVEKVISVLADLYPSQASFNGEIEFNHDKE